MDRKYRVAYAPDLDGGWWYVLEVYHDERGRVIGWNPSYILEAPERIELIRELEKVVADLADNKTETVFYNRRTDRLELK